MYGRVFAVRNWLRHGTSARYSIPLAPVLRCCFGAIVTKMEEAGDQQRASTSESWEDCDAHGRNQAQRTAYKTAALETHCNTAHKADTCGFSMQEWQHHCCHHEHMCLPQQSLSESHVFCKQSRLFSLGWGRRSVAVGVQSSKYLLDVARGRLQRRQLRAHHIAAIWLPWAMSGLQLWQ